MSKLFLDVEGVCKRLGINRSRLQRLFPVLPHLHITERGMRRFPKTYINALEEFLRIKGASAMPRDVEAFWQNPAIQELAKKAQREFEKRLAAKQEFSAEDVANIFEISKMTVSKWNNAGLLNPKRQEYPAEKRQKGQKPRVLMSYPATQLRQIYTWQFPQA